MLLAIDHPSVKLNRRVVCSVALENGESWNVWVGVSVKLAVKAGCEYTRWDGELYDSA